LWGGFISGTFSGNRWYTYWQTLVKNLAPLVKSSGRSHFIAALKTATYLMPQHGLNEQSNGLLRRDGLFKQMDFNTSNQTFASSVASKRNNIPRMSLDYKTLIEVFLENVPDWKLSSLI